jgi:RNA polymerase sigma-70 factor (ECF subfamily)
MANDELEARSTLTLLSEARRGNERAIDVLLERHRRLLLKWGRGRVPRNVRDLVDTEDLVQDVLARTMGHLGSFDPQHSGAFRAYLRRSFLRQVIDQQRRVQKRPPPAETAGGVPDGRPSPQDEVIQRDTIERYERALSQLEGSDRELLIARIELGMKYGEIAEALGKPTADAARKAVTQAVKRLAAHMAAEERIES